MLPDLFVRGCRSVFLTLLTAILAAGQPVSADLFTFTAGGTVELPAEYDGDQVRLLAPDRVYHFLKTDFQDISARSLAHEEWVNREETALQGDSFDRLDAARWAWTHGLTREAESLLRRPSAPPAEAAGRLDRLRNRLAALEPDWSEPDALALTGELGGKFAVARGPHVILFHQHSEAEAAERVELLEQVIRAFFLEFEDLGISLPHPKARLVSVWYRTHRPYIDYLGRQGASAFKNTRGFHHVTRGVVVAYDSRSDPEQVMGRDALDREQAKLAGGADGSVNLLANTPEARKLRDLERQRLLFDLRWRELDIGTAAHETIHQLVAQTGLAPGYPAFPAWLHEGLAMQYEPVVGGRWAGSAPVTPLRLRDYRAMPQPPALTDLLLDKGLGQGYRREPYAASWAWVHFLRTHHPRIWLALLEQLRSGGSAGGGGPGSGTSQQRASAAILAKGPGSLKLWERQWHERTAEFWKQPKSVKPVQAGQEVTPSGVKPTSSRN